MGLNYFTMKKIKDRLRRFIFKLFEREIVATFEPPIRIKREELLPVKLAYTFETDPMAGVNSGVYPLAKEHEYRAQMERGKRELFKRVMEHVEVTVEPVFKGRPGASRVTMSVLIFIPKTVKPASYDTNPR
jgi:hypothetical protein